MRKKKNPSSQTVTTDSSLYNDMLIVKKEIDTLLSTHGMHEKEPHPVAKGMSWMKTNMKLAMNNSDQTIAVLVTDGCDMGINSLQKYLNEHENADHIAKGMCKKLISIEEKLRKDLKKYL